MKSYSFLGLGIVALCILFGLGYFYFFYTPAQDTTITLTNPILNDFPGSASFIYKDYLRKKNDRRFSNYEMVVDYAKRGTSEVALVKDSINDTTTRIVFARAGGSLVEIPDSYQGEKRLVTLSPSGRLLAYTYYLNELSEDASYRDIAEWGIRVIDTETGEEIYTTLGYSPQFITDQHILFVTPDGVLSADIKNQIVTETGITIPGAIGVPGIRVSSDGTMLVVLDRNAFRYHMFVVEQEGQTIVRYQESIDWRTYGILQASIENELWFVNNDPETGFNVHTATFETFVQPEFSHRINRL